MLGSEHQMAMTYVGTPLYMSPVSNLRNSMPVHFSTLDPRVILTAAMLCNQKSRAPSYSD